MTAPVSDTKKVADGAKVPQFSFSSLEYEARESQNEVVLTVVRFGDMSKECQVKYQTINGTADAGKDFEHTQGTLHFEAELSKRQIPIQIIDDNTSEGNEFFFVKLFQPSEGSEIVTDQAMVTIVDNDSLGTFNLNIEKLEVLENVGDVELTIERTNGSSGGVNLKLTLCDKDAVLGKDFQWADEKFADGREQIVAFAENEKQQKVKIKIIDDDEFEKDEKFYVDLELVDNEDMKLGAMIGTRSKCTITILNDDAVTETREKIAKLLNLNMDKMSVSTTSYMQQFRDAISLDSSDDLQHLDYVLHFLTLGWKVIFATVPPTNIKGGWVTFFVALIYIAIMTMCVGDIAALFGCTVGLSKPVTAITFVALGTSLPDLFASMSSAVSDEYADAAVGNVTGSNAVNVYLGLGLPWMIGVMYHSANGTEFLVSGGPLGFSVIIFTVCGVSCIGTIYLRRSIDAELGGQKIGLKYATGAFFVFLWMMYILLNILNLYFKWMGFPDEEEINN
jgi:solute carrier family 8 (sodium/calcium exchanger)